jgi:hypothetical protein
MDETIIMSRVIKNKGDARIWHIRTILFAKSVGDD